LLSIILEMKSEIIYECIDSFGYSPGMNKILWPIKLGEGKE